MAEVKFKVRLSLRVPTDRLWQALVDWRGHGKWIPATTVEVHAGDGGVGTEFTATSGFGPLALPDRMRVTEFDEAGLRAVVEKLGPVLTGTAGFELKPSRAGTSLTWFEQVQVKSLPDYLAPIAGWIGSLLFTAAIARLEMQLRRSAG